MNRNTMKAVMGFMLTLFVLSNFFQLAMAGPASHYVELLQEMFQKVTVEKNANLISTYYHPDFKLYSNGKEMSYVDFLKSHQEIYKTPIVYQMRYDENTWVEQGDKVAVRLFITTKMPNQAAREIEVVLIATYKDNKLYRLWELTYPDWSKMKSFEKVNKK